MQNISNKAYLIGFDLLQGIFEKPKASFGVEETRSFPRLKMRQMFMKWKLKTIIKRNRRSSQNEFKIQPFLKLLLTRTLRTTVHRCCKTYFRRWKATLSKTGPHTFGGQNKSIVEALDQAMIDTQS